jgi:uncharacterized flavoprotein (TIGR03862 family)
MENLDNKKPATVAVIGAGPAGLMAAERLAEAGLAVTVYDRMPSPGRKLLMAGRGGLNLTHSEPIEPFLARYRDSTERLKPSIEAFSPEQLRAWAEDLGEATFVGSSGRIFPKSLKASPLLRAWLRRLDGLGVRFALRHDWLGFNGDRANRFALADGTIATIPADATLLALGGGSWPRLGSNGAWTAPLREAGVAIVPLRPANGGFRTNWSSSFGERFAGTPLKTLSLHFGDRTVRGEALVTERGIEGGAIYTLSAELRDAIGRDGSATLTVDLCPQRSEDEIAKRIAGQKPGQSLSNLLRKAVSLSPVAINLLREMAGGAVPREPEALAHAIKSSPLVLTGTEGIDRAISTAGGVAWDAVDDHFMLKALPGVFVAGEMIDWEAPTGGYLLQASLSTGAAAAKGIARYLAQGGAAG